MFSIYTAAYLAVRIHSSCDTSETGNHQLTVLLIFKCLVCFNHSLYRNVESEEFLLLEGHRFDAAVNSIYRLKKTWAAVPESKFPSVCSLSLAGLISCFISGVGPSTFKVHII